MLTITTENVSKLRPVAAYGLEKPVLSAAMIGSPPRIAAIIHDPERPDSMSSQEIIVWDSQGNLISRSAHNYIQQSSDLVFWPDYDHLTYWGEVPHKGSSGSLGIVSWNLVSSELHAVVKDVWGYCDLVASPDAQHLAILHNHLYLLSRDHDCARTDNANTGPLYLDSLNQSDLKLSETLFSVERIAALVDTTVFSPDSHLLGWSQARDPRTVVMKLHDRTTSKIRDGGTRILAISPSNAFAITRVVGVDRRVDIWDLQAEQIVANLRCEATVRLAAYSPNGEVLVTGNAEGILHFWDVKAYELLHRYKEHSGRVESVIFSETGRELLTAGDNRVVIWRVVW